MGQMQNLLQILKKRWGVLTPIALMALIAYSSRFVGGWAAVLFARRLRVPQLSNRVFVVTGGNRGNGFQLVAQLAKASATVILCTRSLAKGNDALKRMQQLFALSGADVHVMELDLASLASVRNFAKAFAERFSRLDGLILNAGISKTMQDADGFRLNADGFEEMIGANFLGHVHLTMLLLPLLRSTAGSRVVAMTSVSSANSYPSGIDYDSWTQRIAQYSDWSQYSETKLALILFIEQLQRREPSILAVACHPGVARSGLTHTGSLLDRIYSDWFVYLMLAMREEHMVLNSLYCATAEGLEPGCVYHPVGRRGFKTHWYQRVGALQWPSKVQTKHDDLLDNTLRIIASAEQRLSKS